MPQIENEASLCAEFQKWTADQKLPPMSADELIHEDITADQRKYLSAFIIRWEAEMEKQEIEAKFGIECATLEDARAFANDKGPF
jgi:hypothetical protein